MVNSRTTNEDAASAESIDSFDDDDVTTAEVQDDAELEDDESDESDEIDESESESESEAVTELARVEPTTESVTFTMSLPVQVHVTPDDEAAVSISEVAINPDYMDVSGPATTTVTMVADEVATMPEGAVEEVVIPALPAPDDVYTRRGRQRGEISARPEPATMLTAERLIVQGKGRKKSAPEGFWQHLLYTATFHGVNVGDSYAVRHRKSIDARISKNFEGGTRFVAVLTRKGGVGKTTISALLGMAMADVRDDRVIAIDANPDRGTLAERITRNTRATVRDVITRARSVTTFSEFQTLISRDETRMDVLASDADPTVSEAFDEDDYNVVADIAERFYSVAITDCGTGMLHSAMSATLQRADSIIIVSGGSVDEARLASETLTWLESNGYPELVKNAVVALNTATQGTNLVKLEEIEAHFQSRVRAIARIPYDPTLATGSVIRYLSLKSNTRNAARELAAIVVDGLDEQRAS
ncbi:MinD/ParA family protein [Salinibacterium sp. G-O1]|uniref:MinD/ParA family ATP-binding protein n=1 Tax=Salinibacterium sp. G-O1 TaxID=3046208 RepID=UPI0024B8E793|nr:MinD/ParA family protein [Salinibacterium sp. G-O1]MDJ0334973.1 MinD/ParA family protein [Salinibacterium sp. G-O1]